jgi:signal transduction histidine kinase
VALCLFRISQEGLNNIAKHSQARSAQLRIARVDRGIQLTIEDDGVGFDTAGGCSQSGLGFISMRERLRLVQGTLRIDSRQDKARE